jgi:outer membrane protein assembly factor BamB
VDSTPAFAQAEGIVYISENGGSKNQNRFFALHAHTGKIKWQYITEVEDEGFAEIEKREHGFQSPSVTGSTVFFTSNYKLFEFSHSGSLLWSKDYEAETQSAHEGASGKKRRRLEERGEEHRKLSPPREGGSSSSSSSKGGGGGEGGGKGSTVYQARCTSPALGKGSDQTVYIACDSTLHAIDTETKETRWTHELMHYGYTRASAAGSFVFIPVPLLAKVKVLRASDGTEVWMLFGVTEVFTTPTVNAAETIVYFGGDGGSMYAYGLDDGLLRWRYRSTLPVFKLQHVTSATYYNGTVSEQIDPAPSSK